MTTKIAINFSAKSSMSSIGDHVLNVLFVLVRRKCETMKVDMVLLGIAYGMLSPRNKKAA